jgi:hypothetical protein
MILHFFLEDKLTALPRDLLSASILCFVDAPSLALLCTVSREAREIAESDASWQPHYERQFGVSNPQRFDFGASLKESYRQRLRDPSAGDKVEVAWQGRFRLEGLEVYRGLAWWAAEVVEKKDNDDCQTDFDEQIRNNSIESRPRSGSWGRRRSNSEDSMSVLSPDTDERLRRYKVHYLNWDTRWDEWVTREQLRWPVNEGKTCVITLGDDVEVWCSGNTVPGAWLRAVVANVEDDLYCVGNVASSGRLWVKRDRVRLVKRVRDAQKRFESRLSLPCRFVKAAAEVVKEILRRFVPGCCCHVGRTSGTRRR